MSYTGWLLQMEQFIEEVVKELTAISIDKMRPALIQSTAKSILEQWDLEMAVDFLRWLGYEID